MSELEAVKQEITKLAAETLALQFVLASVLATIGEDFPQSRGSILKAFDSAANSAERLSIQVGKAGGHLPETLKVIEQLRTAVKGKDKPRRDV